MNANPMDDTLVVEPIKRLVPSSVPITNKNECDAYWTTLLKLWKLPSSIRHFPAANPVSIERENFQVLKEDDFLAALKTDGVRHILLMTLRPNTSEPISIMIDRALNMYEIEVWASESYFIEGSLFDGELVWNNDKFESLDFMVFDVVCAKGICCIKMPYRDRLQVLHDTIMVTLNTENMEDRLSDEDKFIAMNNVFNIRILPKKCVPKNQIKTLWEDKQYNMHRNDGLIFTKNGCDVQMGTCNDIFKWKPTHSIDVWIDNDLNIFGNSNISSKLEKLVNDDKSRTFVVTKNRLMCAIESRLPCIIECLISIDNFAIHLIPERERTDKKHPNTQKVIAATIKNAEEMITITELHDLLKYY